MSINNRFIVANTKQLYEYEKNNLSDNQIIFIKDTKEIITKGVIFCGNSNDKQDILVSGENIKTINGNSLLGSGDIKVCKKLVTTTDSSISLEPNIYYRNINSNLSSLTITLNPETDNDILNEYFIEFTTKYSGTTIMFPSNIKWANGETPVFEPGITYQISIVNNLGICIKFS